MRAAVLVTAALLATTAAASPPKAVQLTFDDGEARAALAILDLLARRRPVPEPRWRDLFATTGFRRLVAREQSMSRTLTEADMRAYLGDPATVTRARVLRDTLARWSRADLDRAARRALAYLPANTTIRATVYPSIKPRQNSFVFEVDTDPAIFLALDPEVGPAKLENTVGHELHHVGFAAACHAAPDSDSDTPAGLARRWTGALGEGLAMLAAAGGPDVHPHAASPAADRARWDRDLARVAADLPAVDRFLTDVATGALTGDAVTEKARTFYGEQGPWYTVGYHVGVTIERRLGRPALVAAMCDGGALLAAYNRAAPPGAPRFSDALVGALARKP